jgi:thioredoxin 1
MLDVIDIQANSFDDIIKRSNVPVVIEFWIRSCDNCRKFKSVYEQLPSIYGERVRFLRINMMKSIENLRMAEGMGVEQTPTTKVFCDSSNVGEIVGYKPLDEAIEEINKILKADLCKI